MCVQACIPYRRYPVCTSPGATRRCRRTPGALALLPSRWCAGKSNKEEETSKGATFHRSKPFSRRAFIRASPTWNLPFVLGPTKMLDLTRVCINTREMLLPLTRMLDGLSSMNWLRSAAVLFTTLVGVRLSKQWRAEIWCVILEGGMPSFATVRHHEKSFLIRVDKRSRTRVPSFRMLRCPSTTSSKSQSICRTKATGCKAPTIDIQQQQR